MTTVSDLLTDALIEAGVITMAQTPSASQLNRALTRLNNMLDSWSNDGINVFARTWVNYTLTPMQASYQIGTGAADFNTPRPSSIASAYIRIGNVDIPVAVINDQIYAEQIAVKNIGGPPKYLNYDNGFPIGLIRLWPLAGSSYQLFMQLEAPLGDYALTDTVSLPPGWNRAVIFNLAVELCGSYGQQMPEAGAAIAQKSFSLIRKQVLRQRSLDKYPMAISSNNIYSGWFT